MSEMIGVIGAGTMGNGIAQTAANAGFSVVMCDISQDFVDRGVANISKSLDRFVKKETLTGEQKAEVIGRIGTTTELDGLKDCSLVVEAATENFDIKKQIFERLDSICGPDAILATNTSSLSVTAIAAGVDRPGRVCGMHFFNPPPLMRLVEIVTGDDTADETAETATEVARAMRREPIRAADGIGFVANRCARPFTLEALRLFGERIAPIDQIDRIVRIGGGFRMGPFELMDLVGVDVNFEVAKSFWEQSFHEPRWQPHPIQARMVAAGHHGRKSGRGYYDYGEPPHRPDDPDPPSPEPGWRRDPGLEDSVHHLAIPTLETARLVEVARNGSMSDDDAAAVERYFRAGGKHVEWVGEGSGLVLGRILAQIVNEAHFAVSEGVTTKEDCDTAMRLGFNWPRGAFEWGSAIGLGRAVAILDALHQSLGEPRYRVSPLLRARAAEERAPD